ncbi:hypothetical protein MSAN_01242900 [Mycena sanguinolenta]|uniref:Uncharacterized protein n=1 Tax=Mycena sanguinolenta TaxID=230812 RepID=A0A8H7D4G0_9AGAR|nr:hypothetical protein MSAN_01242900 [Mycena sanguinolenta]
MTPAPQPPVLDSNSSRDTASQPDIDRKIRLYGAIAAMRRSRLPTNDQIANALEYVKTNSPVDERKLSTEGQRLITDIRDIIATFSGLLQEKNKGEILQRFVWATRGVDTSTMQASEAEKGKGKDDVEKAKRDAQEAAHHLRTLLSLVLTNAEMRKLITDAGTIGRDLLAKGTAKAAEAVAPKPDQLARADDPGLHDHFVDAGTRNDRVGTATAEPSTSISSSLSDSSLPSSDSESDSKTKDGKKSLLSRFQSLHSSHKDKIDEGRAWLADEYFPEERRERWIWRGKKVIVECQKHKDYAPSVSWLLNTIDAWARRARDVGQGAKEGEGLLPAATLAQDPSLRSALDLLRTLLERIANAPLEPIFAAARVLAKDSANDESLRKWWISVDGYVRKVLLQAGYVTEPACANRARELRDEGRVFYREKYRTHFDAVIDTSSAWFKSIAEDPLNKALAQDFARFTRDFLFDAEGNLQFKRKLWEDVRSVILPTLVDKVGYIPIPRVEYTDDNFDLIMENLTLSGRHLFPNIVELEAHNFMRFSPYTAADKGDASSHEFTFTFAQIHADMRDVAFSFRTKTGIKMSDSGLADVVLGGDGLTVRIPLYRWHGCSRTHFWNRLRSALCRRRTPAPSSAWRARASRSARSSSRIRDSKHDLLYKTFKPLATRLIKKQIQKALEDAIRTGFEYIDGQLVGVRDRMAEAKASDEGSRREVLAELFKRSKKDDVSLTAASTTSHSQFKVVASKQNSLLPDSGHPAGWVNRTAEKQELAEQGDEWRSEAYVSFLPFSSGANTYHRFDIKPTSMNPPLVKASA